MTAYEYAKNPKADLPHGMVWRAHYVNDDTPLMQVGHKKGRPTLLLCIPIKRKTTQTVPAGKFTVYPLPAEDVDRLVGWLSWMYSKAGHEEPAQSYFVPAKKFRHGKTAAQVRALTRPTKV